MMVSYRCRSGCRYCFLFFGAVLHFVSFHVVVVALVIIHSFSRCTHALYRASQVQYVLLGSLYALRCVSASIYKIYMPATYGLSYLVRSTCQFKLFTHAWAQIGRYTYGFIFGRFNELFHFNLNFVAYVQ